MTAKAINSDDRTTWTFDNKDRECEWGSRNFTVVGRGYKDHKNEGGERWEIQAFGRGGEPLFATTDLDGDMVHGEGLEVRFPATPLEAVVKDAVTKAARDEMHRRHQAMGRALFDMGEG